MRQLRVVVLVVLAATLLRVGPASADRSGVSAARDGEAVLAPLAVTSLAVPQGVLASDGKIHVAYELLVVNQTSSPAEITTLTVLSGKGTVLATLTGESLSSVLALLGGAEGTAFAPGSAGYVFIDLTLPAETTLPRVLKHRFDLVLGQAGGTDPQRNVSFTGVPVAVNRADAVAVAAPLRGSGWVVGNGCCAPPTAHRGATLSIDGTVHVAERFAIDFVQLGDNDAIVQGDRTKNEDYGYFGEEIRSVAAGTVVNLQDGLPEQIPNALPEGQTVQTAGGNYVVVDIGHHHFAFYAHMQPGSLEVEVGDKVRTGQVLGRLGNTGNTDGAHLHFHVMDGPSPLRSNGVPFVFKRFTVAGVVADEAALVAGEPVTMEDARAGVHRNEMPLNLDVISFGG